MDILDAIKQRKSIRAYKPETVSREILSEILTAASRAPSAMNIQPWEFIVLAGDVLDRIKQANIEALLGGQPPAPEHSVVGWPRDTAYRKRQVELGKELFRLMDIARDDMEKRMQWMQRGFRFFDAPAAILILTDRVLSESTPLIDIGAVTQTICLAALKYGLGTCIEDQGVMYPKILREHVKIPEGKRVNIAIAIGYPDLDFPANRLVSTRESLESITTWVGFD